MAEIIGCFKCGAPITRQDVCLQCGEDLRLYKRILANADRCYNLGLEMARVRDLTGARNYLRQALQMNKNHVKARNLLGLVYYEMGEPGLALKEWVISSSIKPEDNNADRYLKNSERNMHSINGSVTRYNMALEYLKKGSRDLAMIQLKQMMGRPYQMLRARQLLALLYIQDEHYRSAQKILKECQKVDKGNPVTRQYIAALEEHKKATRSNSYRMAMSRAVAEGEQSDVIIPKATREYGSYFMYVLYIMIGLILGAGLVYFIVVPAVRSKEQEKNNDSLFAYEDAMSEWQNEVVKKNSVIEELEKTVAGLKESIGKYEHNEETLSYDVFLPVLEAFSNANPEAIGTAFEKIDFDLSNEEYVRIYNMLKSYILSDLGAYADYQARAYMSQSKYEKALQMMKYSIEQVGYTSENTYYLGFIYHVMEQNTLAAYFYKYCMLTFPDGEAYLSAEVNLKTLLENNPDLEMPKVVAGEQGSGKKEWTFLTDAAEDKKE